MIVYFKSLIACSRPAALWSQYRLRERVGLLVNPRIESLTHPLTQVVLTSSSEV